jgi:hypothetical protein
MTREELIAALKKATGPSEELDEAIATWCYEHGAIAGVNYDPVLWLMRNEGFTHSIDAALTLVPETNGKRWYQVAQAWSQATAHVRVYPVNPWEGRTREAVADAPAPALALCIAALKAQGDEA